MDNEDAEDKLNKAGQWASDTVSQAVGKLTHMENGAVKSGYGKKSDGMSGSDDSAKATKDREDNPDGSIINHNLGKKGNGAKAGLGAAIKSKGKITPQQLKAAWKKGGPIGITILLFFVLCAGAIFGSQTMMPFSIANRLIEEKNSLSYSNSARYNYLFRYLASKDKLSKKQIQALKDQGIEIDTKTKKGEVTMTWHEEIDGKDTTKSASFHNDKYTFQDALDSNPGLKEKYQVGMAQWKGQNSGWYDKTTKKTFASRLLDKWRSHFNDYEDTGDPVKDKAEIQKRIATKGGYKDDGVTAIKQQEDPDNPGRPATDEKGNPVYNEDSVKDGSLSQGQDKTQVETSLKEKAKLAVEGGADAVCGVMAASGAISAIVVGQQILEMMNFAGSYLESVQKVQAGDGSKSPMHYFNRLMTETDANGKSAMTSTGISSLFNKTSGAAPIDDSTLSANIEGVTKKIQKESNGIATSYTSEGFRNCSYGRAVQGFASGVIDVVSGGAGSFIKSVVIGATVSVVIGAAIENVIPWLAGIYIRNLATDLVGEDLGNVIGAGAALILSTNHRSSGGSPGTKKKVLAYQQQKQAVIAERAEYDRTHLSPFDTSSRHTFFGSLAYSVSSKMATSTGGLFGMLSQASSIVQNSVTSLLPPAAAVATTNLDQYEGDCPTLNSVDGVGDAFCNPYYITDTQTIDIDEDELLQRLVQLGDIDNADTLNPKPKKNSQLAMYQEFCGNRQSNFGIADGAIASHFDGVDTGNARLDAAIDGGIGVIPIVGGLADIATAVQRLSGQDWISGKKCIADDEPGSFWQERGKYYQRFSEDQRLLTDVEVIGENTEYGESHILALGEEYRQEITADQSYEAQLARVSGMTKDQVIETLAYLDELQFLANYNPSNLGPLPAEAQVEEMPDFTSSSVIANMQSDNPTYNSTNFAQHFIAYTDLRTRTQVA